MWCTIPSSCCQSGIQGDLSDNTHHSSTYLFTDSFGAVHSTQSMLSLGNALRSFIGWVALKQSLNTDVINEHLEIFNFSILHSFPKPWDLSCYVFVAHINMYLHEKSILSFTCNIFSNVNILKIIQMFYICKLQLFFFESYR